jgi:hypothetical protein
VGRWFRRAAELLAGAGGAIGDTSSSTLTAAAWAPTADGVTTDALTFTLRDALSAGMPFESWTATVERVSLSASLSEVTASPSSIENDGVDEAFVTATIRDEDGYAAPGIAASAVVLAVTGSGNTVTQPASATNASGQTSGSFVTTQAATKTASITAAGLAITDTAAVEASGGGGAATWDPLLQSDWGTATGVTSNAIGDGGIYSLSTDFEDNGEVIAARPGFDSTNILEVSSTGVRSGFLDLSGTLPEMVDGEVRNFRIKVENVHQTIAEGSTDNGHHGWQDGGGGGVQNWNLTDETNFVGEWQPKILINAFYSYYLVSASSPARLSKGVPYTFEVQQEGTSPTEFTLKAWVYDEDGVLLYGPEDFITNASGPLNGTTLAAGSEYTYNNLAGTTSIHVGCNGDGSSNWPSRIVYAYWGEHAVVSSEDNPSLTSGTTIGPYGSVIGEA